MIIDATDRILGRLASEVAKRLLEGEEIVIVNAEKAVISGSKENIFGEYKEMMDKGSKEKGPYFPRMPDRILHRTIRGMLPYKKMRGRDALSRLRVYMGIPDEYTNDELSKLQIDLDRFTKGATKEHVNLDEVSKKLGWKG
jgi:large subunit ribosomal protein L13